MIELLLDADRAMAIGLLDQAERMYRQAIERDPRNAIAVVGLARVALERGDERRAHAIAGAALLIDPENLQGQRILARTADVLRARREPLPPPSSEFAASGGRAARSERDKRPGLLRRLLGRR